MALKCARCRRPLAEAEARHVSRWVAIPAAVALAFAHGGMWASEELARTYCARCRRTVTLFAVLIAIVMLGAASVGVAIWLRGP
jgi:hypothetical protein